MNYDDRKKYLESSRMDSQNNKIVRLLFVQAACSILMLVTMFSFVVYAASVGVTTQKVVNHYVDSSALTPERVGSLVNMSFDIVKNVDDISSNVVPISARARSVAEKHSAGSAANVTEEAAAGVAKNVANVTGSALNALSHITSRDVAYLLRNVTKFIGNAATINFTSITDLLYDFHDPSTQKTIRERVDHALESLDKTTSGIGYGLKMFRRGAEEEEKKSEL